MELKSISVRLRALIEPTKKTVTQGHGKYSLGSLQRDETLASSLGCIYLALVPSSSEEYYFKIGISKYPNANERKKSLPKGSQIFDSQAHELHRCFQAEQEILSLLKDQNINFSKCEQFDGYTEVLCKFPRRYGCILKYKLAIRKALKNTKPFDEFLKL